MQGNIFTSAMRGGLALGVLFSVNFLLSVPQNTITGLLTYAVMAVIVAATYRLAARFRDQECGGYIGYGKAFAFILASFFYAALISSLVKFIYFQFINPDYLGNLYNQSMLTLEKMGLSAADGVEESLEALQTAITAAQAVADNDDATTSEVTEAITNLSDAIAGLVEEAGVDKSALAHEIELVNEMIANLDDYVPSSVEGLADKLASAQQVYDDANATQEEVDAATQALREARLNARTKADTSALEEIIAYANSLDLSGYSRASVAALNQAIAQNKLMLNDPEVSQDTVDAAVTEIQNAIDALEPASSASVDGAGTTASSGISSSVTNTAAQAQTGLFVGVLAVAACGVLLMVIKKRRNKA